MYSKRWLVAVLTAVLVGAIVALVEIRFGEFSELQRGVVHVLQLAVGFAVLIRKERR